MIEITYILLAVIVLVVLIDLYLKKKNKLAITKDIEKVIDKEHPEKKEYKKPVVIVTATLLLLIASFFGVNQQFYDGRLTDTDDGISLLQNITETQYNISDINFIGDSIYKFNDNTNANGLIYCEYGNIGMLINGKPDGLWTLYHSNGAKKMRVLLINGEQEGIRTDWYNDGSKEFEGNYSEDKQKGFSEFWYKNGQKELEGDFDKGDFSGDYTKWYENGSVKYVYNHQEKTYKEYWDNGNIYCDANSVTKPYLPLNINPTEEINVYADFYSKEGELINKIPFTRKDRFPKTNYRHISGGPCRGENYCAFYNYFINGDIFTMSYEDHGNHIDKEFFENGEVWKFFNGDDWTFYSRNGQISSFANNKKKIFKRYRNGTIISTWNNGKSSFFKRLYVKTKDHSSFSQGRP